MIVFLLEEPSMKFFLEGILPKILGDEKYFLISHEGKGDLLKSIPIKLKAWTSPDARFVIVHDQDNNDCIELKSRIEDICRPYKKIVLIRIVCRELESWYFGDLEAVEKAYEKDLRKLRTGAKYRIPDDIQDPKKVIRGFVPELTQIEGAKRISKLIDIEKNTSHSFRVFVDGVRNLTRNSFCDHKG